MKSKVYEFNFKVGVGDGGLAGSADHYRDLLLSDERGQIRF